MSVSVFHRFAMSEARTPLGRPPSHKVERVRKALTFGDNSAPPAKVVAADEMAETLKRQSEHWNFDFVNGVPLNSAGSTIEWTKISQTDRVHESYALNKFPFLRSHAENAEETSDEKKPTTSCSRQSSITEFMTKRKRSSGASCSKSQSSSGSLSSSQGSSDETASASANRPAKQRRTSST